MTGIDPQDLTDRHVTVWGEPGADRRRAAIPRPGADGRIAGGDQRIDGCAS
jgi:hypothetical protein